MSYAKRTYLWMTLDPVHIGTGGYRLGRVDLSIAREPGTKLPKIPGTSLSGAARSYAAMNTGLNSALGRAITARSALSLFVTPLAVSQWQTAIKKPTPARSTSSTRTCSFSPSTRWPAPSG